MSEDVSLRGNRAAVGQADEQALSPWWAVAVIAAAALIVFVAGATSHVVKGDEVYHYMFAEAWTEAGLLNRPAHHPLYASGESGYYYTTEAFWPMLCALLWKVTGVHPWVAQACQAGFYVLLLAAVYLLGRRLVGPRGALVALLVAVGVPMFGAFSVLLYVGVPAAALTLLAVVLMLDRRFFWAGLAMGLAYLTKRNAFFLVPPLMLWAVCLEGSLWQRVRRLIVLMVVMAAVVVPDVIWRRYSFPSLYEPVHPDQIVARVGTFFSRQLLASNLNNAADLLRYFGAVVPLLLAVYFLRRAWRRADGWLWLLIAFYLGTLVVLFTLDTEVRYTLPAAPLLVLVSARALTGWWRKSWVLGLLAAAAFAHLGATACHVNLQRRISPAQQAVFTYLRTRTPEDSRVIYPGEVLIAQARRQAVWCQLKNPETGGRWITSFLRERRPETILSILRGNDIGYICVDRAQVYEDGAERVSGGYPRSFVARLPTLPFLEKVRGDWEKVRGDWPTIELWKVKDDAARETGEPDDTNAPQGAGPGDASS